MRLKYRDPEGETKTVEADACVVATPLPVAATICAPIKTQLGLLNDTLRFTQAINVAIGTTRPANTPAFLVQLPATEDREVCMIIIENNKAPDRAPAGHGLLSVCWEMSAATAWMQRTDDELVERSLQTVLRLFPELRDTVDFTYVRRWPVALPQTRVGVYRQIATFTSNLDRSLASNSPGTIYRRPARTRPSPGATAPRRTCTRTTVIAPRETRGVHSWLTSNRCSAR